MAFETRQKLGLDELTKAKLYDKLREKILRLCEFTQESLKLTENLEFEQLLNLIVKHTVALMKPQGCTLRLLSPDGKRLILKASYGLSKTSDLRKDIPLGKNIAGRGVKQGQPYIVDDLASDKRYARSPIVRKERFRSLLSVPLAEKKRIVGTLSVYSNRPHNYTEDDMNILSMLAGHSAIAIENARLFAKVRLQSLNVISALANIIDTKDSYTRGHSEKVMRYALLIAEAMDLSKKEKEIIQYASLLHDMGKIGVDLSVLRKPGPLTKEEWKQIFAHPQIGAEIISRTGLLEDLAPIILHHHERYEGGGYPDPEKKTEDIPLGARILAVADAFEAMTSDRPYRKARSRQAAKKELKRCAGTQFDPKVVDVFLKVLKKHKI